MIDNNRRERVVAYSIARALWIREFGLPHYDEDNLLRKCYGVGNTTSGEWALSGRIRRDLSDGRAIQDCQGAWRA